MLSAWGNVFITHSNCIADKKRADNEESRALISLHLFSLYELVEILPDIISLSLSVTILISELAHSEQATAHMSLAAKLGHLISCQRTSASFI
jgi:hypothetical protein